MSIIRIDDIAFVRFRAPDLAAMKAFLEDFGLSETPHAPGRLFMRGTGSAPFLHATELGEPGFAGFAFRAASPADLEMLAAAERVPIEALDAPGGGRVVRLIDPDGFPVEVVAGQAAGDVTPLPPRAPWNNADASARLRQVKRVGKGPAHVLRLGHGVLNVADFRRSEAWYKARFGFLTSDEIELQPGLAVGAFLRCDRGDRPADHHTLFLMQNPKGASFNHAAFEVRDLDDLMSGHDFLQQNARQAVWGVGRHILGSQVFDYWRDPWGHRVEHWTDGDLFTAADSPHKTGLNDLLGVQWGPNAPAAMA